MHLYKLHSPGTRASRQQTNTVSVVYGTCRLASIEVETDEAETDPLQAARRGQRLILKSEEQEISAAGSSTVSVQR